MKEYRHPRGRARPQGPRPQVNPGRAEKGSIDLFTIIWISISILIAYFFFALMSKTQGWPIDFAANPLVTLTREASAEATEAYIAFHTMMYLSFLCLGQNCIALCMLYQRSGKVVERLPTFDPLRRIQAGQRDVAAYAVFLAATGVGLYGLSHAWRVLAQRAQICVEIPTGVLIKDGLSQSWLGTNLLVRSEESVDAARRLVDKVATEGSDACQSEWASDYFLWSPHVFSGLFLLVFLLVIAMIGKMTAIWWQRRGRAISM